MNDPDAADSDGAITQSHEILRVGSELELDLPSRHARRRKRSARLRPIEAQVLAGFMRAPGRVISHQELIDEHWGGAIDRTTLQNVIVGLRRALGTDLIRTVPGTGYQLTVGKPSRDHDPVSLRAGELTLDAPARELRRANRGPVLLTARETRLLARLIRAVGAIVIDEELMHAGGIDAGNVRGYVVSMSTLRRKLRALDADALLVFLDGGYRLAGAHGFLRIAGLELDLGARTACLHGRPLEELWPTWFALLERLAMAPGRPVSGAELVTHAWGTDPPSESLGSIIPQLQRALGPTGPRLIVATSDGDGNRLAIERFGLLAVGPLVLDPSARCVRLHDREQQLYPTESSMLEALMRNSGQAIPRTALIAAAGLETTRAFAACVAKLRRKLQRLDGSSGNEALIVTAKGVGYRLAAERLDVDQLDWPLAFAGLQLRPDTRQLRCGSRAGTVAAKPAVMLEQLIRAAGEAVPDDVLIDAIWGPTPAPTALYNCAASLTRALQDVGATIVVKRIRGSGYRLHAIET